MIAVRAKATTGFNSGNDATNGRRIKPVARRAGATISSALQIVGVSNARKASRAAGSGRFGIGLSPASDCPAPGFIGEWPKPARVFAGRTMRGESDGQL